MTVEARARSGVPSIGRTLAWIAVAAAIGFLAGFLAKLADVSGSGEMGIVTSNMAVWTLGVCLWGALASRCFDAAARSVAFTLAMDLGYYAWSEELIGHQESTIEGSWVVLSSTAVPVVAALVQIAVRSPRWWAGGALAVVGAIPLTDEPVAHAWSWMTGDAARLPQAPISAALSVATWAVVVVLLPRHHTTRRWSLVSSIPAYLIVAVAYPALWSVLLAR